jgi:insecticidal toxin complex protein TccC
MESTHAVHRHTPKLAVVDARGLPVASIAYCRTSSDETCAETRLSRETFDAAGRSVANWDPRLGSGPTPVASLTQIHGLAGQPLLTVSVDAGWQLSLQGEALQVQQSWDGQGNTTRFEYDSMSRPLIVEENNLCVERFDYAMATAETSVRNQRGRLIRHVDTAGARVVADYNLSGAPITESRRFLTALDHPGWPADEGQQNTLLEQGADKAYTTRWQYDATGNVLEQIDAAGHTRRNAYGVSGQLQSTWLKLAGKPEHLLVSDMAYSVSGQVERERAGNGVISTSVYDSGDGRLLHLRASKGERTLQDLRYDYDPVGNILALTDASQPVSWFDNQRIEPISRYWYDSLYQLVKATGREVASLLNGPALPELISPPDPARLQNYTQRWCYDAGGNLLEQRHSEKPTHFMDIAPDGNRGLSRVEGQEPDFEEGFDSNGNLRFLAQGQPMRWTARNQLSEVVMVSREDGRNDSERYLYDGAGIRVRKVGSALAASVTRKSEVRYLPGLEIRTRGTDSPDEVLHVINVQAGRNSVRLLHWEQGQPGEIDEDQVRYSLDDHLGSSRLELDHLGSVISHEGYYAYGGTAWWMGRSQVEVNYKFVRYSGKERDATGLYYYGFRYYAPWLQRWINPDPAGIVDGLNMFCMVGNSPVSYLDVKGLYSGTGDEVEELIGQNYEIVARGRGEMLDKYLDTLERIINIAREVMDSSLDALSSTYKNNQGHRRMSRVFGSGIVPEDDMGKVRNALLDYSKGGRHDDQLVLMNVKNDRESTVAMVIWGDNEKRIFFTPIFFQVDFVHSVKTIIHEVSHLELNTFDFYYYKNSPGKSLLSHEYSVNKLNKRVKKIVDESFRQESMAEVSKQIEDEGYSVSELKEVFGAGNVRAITAGVIFGGAFRDKMVAKNADSFALAAIFVGQQALYKYLTPKRASGYSS